MFLLSVWHVHVTVCTANFEVNTTHVQHNSKPVATRGDAGSSSIQLPLAFDHEVPCFELKLLSASTWKHRTRLEEWSSLSQQSCQPS
jgi:hypothetical protein